MSITVIGIDLAKESFQLHGVDDMGNVLLRKKLSREEMAEYFAKLPPCRIVMEACGGAHYWGRKFLPMGHSVQLIAAKFVKPFVKSQKNDRNDAEAIVEAALRPSMRFVAIKSLAQQDLQSLHRARENTITAKTAITNQCRGLLMEYGVTMDKGINKFKSQILWVLEDATNELTDTIRSLVSAQFELFKILCERQKEIENKITALSETQADYHRLLQVPGVGPTVASMILSSVGDVNVFKNGRGFAAWVGLVPRQASTGGKTRLLGITKAGDNQLRAAIIHGARSFLLAAIKKQKKDPLSLWALNILNKKGWNVAAVALANRNCRVMWSMMHYQADYRIAL